jgi:hypothetical protein
VRVETSPPGAAITLNGQQRAERTPATLNLPAGKYHLSVAGNGKRAEQDFELRDGSLVKMTFSLN